MANSYQDYTATSDQVASGFSFSFPYLSDNSGVALLDVYVLGVKLATSAYTISTSPQKIVIASGSVAVGNAVKITRNSSTAEALVDFENGSVLTESDLDRAYLHGFYLSQEAAEGTGGELLSKKGLTHYDAEGNKIINVADPDTGQDVATRHFVETLYDTTFDLTPTDRDIFDYGFIDGGADASYSYGTLS